MNGSTSPAQTNSLIVYISSHVFTKGPSQSLTSGGSPIEETSRSRHSVVLETQGPGVGVLISKDGQAKVIILDRTPSVIHLLPKEKMLLDDDLDQAGASVFFKSHPPSGTSPSQRMGTRAPRWSRAGRSIGTTTRRPCLVGGDEINIFHSRHTCARGGHAEISHGEAR